MPNRIPELPKEEEAKKNEARERSRSREKKAREAVKFKLCAQHQNRQETLDRLAKIAADKAW